jgi:RNA polymerase sigma factor (sigma-70 family)
VEQSPARVYLQRFLQENAVSLQSILRGYVVKLGLATGENVDLVAAEIFQDAVLETLAHAERFNPNMQARPWFLGIVANMLKRYRVDSIKRSRFEVRVGHLVRQPEQENEQDVLEQIMTASVGTASEPEQAFLVRESVRELLALVSAEDAQLLHMALVQGWDANALGVLMNVSPSTARVRLHRALTRLRAAWRKAEQRKERGE